MDTMYDAYGNPIEGEDNAADANAGGLSVYKDAGVVAAMAKRDALATQQQARYDAQAKALAEKRFAPSFSERMFQLSAALAQPTTRRGFGGILENITPVLAAQQKAQREGEISRKEALEQLETNRLAQQVGLVNQDLSTSLALAKLAQQGAGAGQIYDAQRGIFVNRRNPRPTQNAYTDPTTKRTFVQWQDGYWREAQPNGGYKVFEREGEDWVEVGIEGAR
jgi:hypothetical protein